ncbi:MAG: hypothetical protein ACRDI2_26535, partial [Chloroflexota bacterium]
GWVDRSTEPEQLYDLVFDPIERRNLLAASPTPPLSPAGDPQYGPVLAEMRRRLERWMRATGDPLLRGPVPAPEGAKVGDPAALSPSASR